MVKKIKHVVLNRPKRMVATNDDPTKGTQENPYTQEEYYVMLGNGTWSGGWIEGVGYGLPVVVINQESDNWFISWDLYDSWINLSQWIECSPMDWSNGEAGGGIGGGTGISSLSTNKSTQKAAALERITDFQNNGTNTNFFLNIPKTEFVNQLNDQINNPSIIQQGGNGTCGAAVICKFLAEFLADDYAQAAISIFETGPNIINGD